VNRYFAALAFVALLCLQPLQGDDYVHSTIGFVFPSKVASFERAKVTFFNPAHSDVEVDYNNDPFTVHLSVYVYPASGIYTASVPLKVHYEDCKNSVVKTHPDAKLLEEKPYTLEKSGTRYEGYYALYSFRGKFVGHEDQDLLSQVIVFQRGDYYILYRISYAAAYRTQAEGEINEFIDQLAWPSGEGASTK